MAYTDNQDTDNQTGMLLSSKAQVPTLNVSSNVRLPLLAQAQAYRSCWLRIGNLLPCCPCQAGRHGNTCDPTSKLKPFEALLNAFVAIYTCGAAVQHTSGCSDCSTHFSIIRPGSTSKTPTNSMHNSSRECSTVLAKSLCSTHIGTAAWGLKSTFRLPFCYS